MQTLKIEWRHLDVDGETCDRCYDTGENLNAEVKRLNRKLDSKGIKVEWFETKLKDNQIAQSNTILFNGVPIEEILDIKVSENYCDSCTELLEIEAYCRTVFYDGLEYEDIPAKAIREATYKILNLTESQESPINTLNNAGGCPCGFDCCNTSKDTEDDKGRIVIDLLYLDLSVCTRCQGTDTSLDNALMDVSKVLEATGVEVVVNKVHVLSKEQAKKYQFVSSPTIRVNGRDIQMEVKESFCESCGDLCGDNVDCRVWVYQGQEYTVPPKAMITDAILKEVYNSNNKKEKMKEYILPENLKQFYETMKKKSGVTSNNAVKIMKIKIDEKEILVSDPNKNIVEIGDENGITIAAPCFRSTKRHGCCATCVIEIDGIQKYACGTKPQDGMNIIYNRNDLSNIRKERQEKYAQAVKNNDTSNNLCCGTDQQNPIKNISSCCCLDKSCCS